MLKISLIVLSLFFSSAHAEFQIKDPNHLLDQVTAFQGQIPFGQAFEMGDSMVGQTQLCRIVCSSKANCKEVCMPPVHLLSNVKSVASDACVFTNQTEGDPDSASDMTVTRDAYERSRGNFVILYLVEGLGGSKPGPKDFTTIEAATEIEYVLADQSRLKAMTVRLTQNFWNTSQNTYKQLPLSLTVGQNVPGISSMLEVHPNPDTLKTPIFKVLSTHRN
jgi:hypothetical protein